MLKCLWVGLKIQFYFAFVSNGVALLVSILRDVRSGTMNDPIESVFPGVILLVHRIYCSRSHRSHTCVCTLSLSVEEPFFVRYFSLETDKNSNVS